MQRQTCCVFNVESKKRIGQIMSNGHMFAWTTHFLWYCCVVVAVVVVVILHYKKNTLKKFLPTSIHPPLYVQVLSLESCETGNCSVIRSGEKSGTIFLKFLETRFMLNRFQVRDCDSFGDILPLVSSWRGDRGGGESLSKRVLHAAVRKWKVG